MDTIISKGYYYYGNKEYPNLRRYDKVLIEQKGNLRLIEQEYEAITQIYGDDYAPSPELLMERTLQKRVLWMWWSIKSFKYYVPSKDWINDACFGEKQTYPNSWKKVGLWELG